MESFWVSMGFIRYPLAFAVVVIAALTLYSTARLFTQSARSDALTKTWVDAILFWGGFALLTGVLGTLVGIVIAAQSIEAAGAVSAPLVWGGVKVALYSSVFGLLVLAVSALMWFGLNLRWRFLAGATDPA